MHVLLADDEPALTAAMTEELRGAGHEVTAVRDGQGALALLRERTFDVLVADVRLPGAGGLALLDEVRRGAAPTEVVLVTADATVAAAVDAMRKGAFDFMRKPLGKDELSITLRKIEELGRLRRENAALRDSLGHHEGPAGLVAESPAMRAVLERVRQLARSDARVLITGESGTGKERIARAIHDASARAKRPFVALACAAIPSTLIEDELFGHEKGAFTDAATAREGRFQRAHGGTLLLDDIDDMPLETQVKLLRVLQEGVVEPLGGTRTVPVDVRVLTATKVDLAEAVEAGTFREDLLYRLEVVSIELPPLRARPGDVARLLERFLARFGGGRALAVTPEALETLEAHSWPGNVRELENAVERAVALAGNRRELTADLFLATRRPTPRTPEPAAPLGGPLATLRQITCDAEERHIRRVLIANEGRREATARVLGISRKNLWLKMKDYGIDQPAK